MFKRVGLIIVLVVVVLLGSQSFYTLENSEEAVVTRFGKLVSVVDQAGVNFKMPLVDSVTKVKTNERYSVQYGYRPATAPTTNDGATYTDVEDEQIVLTKGSFLVNVGAIIQYRITDPAAYLFNVDDQTGTLRLAFESVLRRNMQNKELDNALLNKESIAKEILPELSAKVNEYGLGITITEVKLTDVLLPDSVKIAYDDVNIANNEKTELVSKATKYQNEQLPSARAEAYKLVKDAEAYRAEKIAQAKGDVENFVQVYEKYAVAKEITKTRLYLESMEQILGKVNLYITMDSDGVLKYLPIDPNALKGGN